MEMEDGYPLMRLESVRDWRGTAFRFLEMWMEQRVLIVTK